MALKRDWRLAGWEREDAKGSHPSARSIISSIQRQVCLLAKQMRQELKTHSNSERGIGRTRKDSKELSKFANGITQTAACNIVGTRNVLN